jgi:YggT family protein
MDIILVPLFQLIITIIDLYIMLIVVLMILSWLSIFGIVNTYNRVVSIVTEFLYRITEPLLQPIRNILPNLGGLDISPLILILLLYFLRGVIERLALYF